MEILGIDLDHMNIQIMLPLVVLINSHSNNLGDNSEEIVLEVVVEGPTLVFLNHNSKAINDNY